MSRLYGHVRLDRNFNLLIKFYKKLLKMDSVCKLYFYTTGDPRYLKGLRSQKVPQIPKPRITREHCMGKKSRFQRQYGKKSADNQGIFRGYQVLGIKRNPWIVKTPNNKPANSKGCLLQIPRKVFFWNQNVKNLSKILLASVT